VEEDPTDCKFGKQVQDGGNSSATKMAISTMKEERSLMLVVERIEKTNVLSCGADTMERTSNGTLSTLMMIRRSQQNLIQKKRLIAASVVEEPSHLNHISVARD